MLYSFSMAIKVVSHATYGTRAVSDDAWFRQTIYIWHCVIIEMIGSRAAVVVYIGP